MSECFRLRVYRFNTQPPEGGWLLRLSMILKTSVVSTHSRLKAAGYQFLNGHAYSPSFNTQPPEGGWFLI